MPAEQSHCLANGPNIKPRAGPVRKKKVASVRRPIAAVLLWRGMPPGQYRMQIRTVRTNLPDGGARLVCWTDCEANSFSVRRFLDASGSLLHRNELSGFAPVRAGHKQIRPAGKKQMMTVGRPRRIMAYHAAQPPGGSRWERKTPEPG